LLANTHPAKLDDTDEPEITGQHVITALLERQNSRCNAIRIKA